MAHSAASWYACDLAKAIAARGDGGLAPSRAGELALAGFSEWICHDYHVARV